MKKYIIPQIKISIFDASVSATNLSSVPDYIYANEIVNKVGFTDYLVKQATSTRCRIYYNSNKKYSYHN